MATPTRRGFFGRLAAILGGGAAAAVVGKAYGPALGNPFHSVTISNGSSVRAWPIGQLGATSMSSGSYEVTARIRVAPGVGMLERGQAVTCNTNGEVVPWESRADCVFQGFVREVSHDGFVTVDLGGG